MGRTTHSSARGVHRSARYWIATVAGVLALLALSPAAFLAHNDAYTFFQALGDLVITGPTRTNVNDYRVILVR